MLVWPVQGPPIETANGAVALGVDVVAGDGDGQPPPVCASTPRDGASPSASAAISAVLASTAPVSHAAQRPLLELLIGSLLYVPRGRRPRVRPLPLQTNYTRHG